MSQETMGGKENSPAPGHRRRRTLGNITNLSLSSSWASDSLGLGLLKGGSGKSNNVSEVAQLREEIAALRKLVADKEADIKAQAAEFVFQLRRHTQVNEELISYNSRLARDGGMLRDQLKLLQHEHSQMSVAYREVQSELKLKLAESQEMVQELLTKIRLQQQSDSSQSCDQDSTKLAANIHSKARSRTSGRRHSIGNLSLDEDWNRIAKNALGMTKSDGTMRLSASSLVADPSGASTVKDPQQQQQQQTHSNRYRQHHQQDLEQWHTPNLYGDLLGLEPMLEDIREGGSPEETTSSASRKSSDDREDSYNLGDLKSVINFPSESKGGSIFPSRSGEAEASEAAQPSSVPLQESSMKRGQASTYSCKTASTQRLQPVTGASSKSTLHFSRRAPAGSVCGSSTANSSSGTITRSGRPTRKAAEKVGSYLEPPLKTKMRRPN